MLCQACGYILRTTFELMKRPARCYQCCCDIEKQCYRSECLNWGNYDIYQPIWYHSILFHFILCAMLRNHCFMNNFIKRLFDMLYFTFQYRSFTLSIIFQEACECLCSDNKEIKAKATSNDTVTTRWKYWRRIWQVQRHVSVKWYTSMRGSILSPGYHAFFNTIIGIIIILLLIYLFYLFFWCLMKPM